MPKIKYYISYITRGGCIVSKAIIEAVTQTDAIAELRDIEDGIQSIISCTSKKLNPTTRVR